MTTPVPDQRSTTDRQPCTQLPRVKPLEGLYGEAFYFALKVTLDNPAEAFRFFRTLSQSHSDNLAGAVRTAVTRLIKLPRGVRVVTVGQMYTLDQALHLDDEDDACLGIELSLCAEQYLSLFCEEGKGRRAVKSVSIAGQAIQDLGLDVGLPAGGYYHHAMFPISLTCLLPVILTGNKRSFEAFSEKLINEQDFWRYGDHSFSRRIEGIFGGKVKTLGLIPDLTLSESSIDTMEVAALTEDSLSQPGVIFYPHDVMPLFIGKGVAILPFLTFDAFANTHDSVDADDLGDEYASYLSFYQGFCFQLMKANVPMAVVRGGRDLLKGSQSEQEAALSALSNDFPIDTVLIETSSHDISPATVRPSLLSACAVMLEAPPGDETAIPDISCMIVSAQDEWGNIIWQQNLYPVLPSDGEALIGYLEKLEHHFGLQMVHDVSLGFPYCEHCRQLMGYYEGEEVESPYLQSVMCH